MRKISTVFVRGDDWKAIAQPMKGCDWVLRGEGIATEKLDGTNVMVVFHQDGKYSVHKRRNPTKQEKELDIQPINVPVNPADNNDILTIEAVKTFIQRNPEHKLYGVVYGEVIGEKIQGNRYNLDYRTWIPFVPPYITIIPNVPRDYEGLKSYLTPDAKSMAYPDAPLEGVVFHHWFESAKIKVEDFHKVSQQYAKKRTVDASDAPRGEPQATGGASDNDG